MTKSEVDALRKETRSVFYHGLTNYRQFAYPDDELRPLSCSPLTRDRANPAHIEVNDVLGNYSLSVVDSLSTLAILASDPLSDTDDYNALHDFQHYVGLVVEEYGDGSSGPAGQGRRARGFDLDSKVQVFETTIRGLGGLLSAHLFAIGELPIRGYEPDIRDDGVHWPNGFVYNGQLLRLAQDLGERLLPAFHTPTGLPYPRVNLRYGTPFYENSPLNNDPEHGQCDKTQKPKGPREITETCSAGAGSLVLEFTTLSRLTNDDRFERLAKRAFWAVWERRSASGLIGAGIDAETGAWVGPWTGIGAGIDSFFEYAFKSHVLLSALEGDSYNVTEDSPDAFLQTWKDAHSAIMRHVYRDAYFTHPHYAQNDLYTGGPRLTWIDSLSAYYPGLLVLAGELDEAITAHLLYTALWSRYGALPERWDATTGAIHGGLRWWGGRPEFIESTWYLYQATKDPWYLHIGEMALRDIKRRCYTRCGWAGLQDVRTGEQTDRMESFFLGETAKYMYLLFDPDHPLNTIDAPWVFTTEGHPLIIPKANRTSTKQHHNRKETQMTAVLKVQAEQCPIPPALLPLTVSSTAARSDVFHAASLARLHLMPIGNKPGAPSLDWASDHPSVTMLGPESPTNFTFYPWTLPLNLIPSNGYSTKLSNKPTFDLTFPTTAGTGLEIGTLQKIDGGVLVNSISGLRFGMVLESPAPEEHEYRIYTLGNFALGRDEHIALSRDTLSQINPTDPHFTRMRDVEAMDLIIDVPHPEEPLVEALAYNNTALTDHVFDFSLDIDLDALDATSSPGDMVLDSLPKALFADVHRLAEQLDGLVGVLPDADSIDDALRDAAKQLRSKSTAALPSSSGASSRQKKGLQRFTTPAMLPIGPGAAPLPAAIDSSPDPRSLSTGNLPYTTILVIDSDLCNLSPIPLDLVTTHTILIIRRGGCSFSKKLSAIPSYPPSARSLQLVLVVSFGTDQETRPLVDEVQLTPKGLPRRHPICLALVPGGQTVWDTFLRGARTVGVVNSNGAISTLESRNPEAVQAEAGATGTQAKETGKKKAKTKAKGKKEVQEVPGIGVRRRYYFTSNGVRISNLIVT
ncbi:glycoside hydrolase family 47 protein, partial [Aureobasidium melanogenum]